MLTEFSLRTGPEGFHDITATVRETVRTSGRTDGLCLVFCPHTTAGITLNENADPDVLYDLGLGLRRAFPDRPEFRHREGNSAAHLKASAIGASVTLIVEDGNLRLGTWQGIYFCEFDGPRERKFLVKLL